MKREEHDRVENYMGLVPGELIVTCSAFVNVMVDAYLCTVMQE